MCLLYGRLEFGSSAPPNQGEGEEASTKKDNRCWFWNFRPSGRAEKGELLWVYIRPTQRRWLAEEQCERPIRRKTVRVKRCTARDQNMLDPVIQIDVSEYIRIPSRGDGGQEHDRDFAVGGHIEPVIREAEPHFEAASRDCWDAGHFPAAAAGHEVSNVHLWPVAGWT